MLIFTDGSLQQNGSAGAGWAGFWGTASMEATCGHLSLAKQEVFDAEATAALAGLKAAFFCPQTHLSSNLYILLDNQETALQLQGTPVCSSQSTFLEFQKVAKEWPSRPNCLPALALGQVHVHWIPGHSGIAGNEAADRQASLGASTPASAPDNPPPARLAWARRALKKNLAKCFEEYWASQAPQSYKNLAIPLDPRPQELSLPRGSLGRLLSARSGHGDFAAYHERFNHPDALMTCSCGQPKAPLHFLLCPLGRQAAPHPWRDQPAKKVLGTSQGALLFHQWVQQSSFFSEICPNHRSTTRPQPRSPTVNSPWPSSQDLTRPVVPPSPLPRPLPGSLMGPTWPRGHRPPGPPGPRSASAPPTGQDLCPPGDLPGPLPGPLPGSLPDPTRPRGQQAPGPPGSRSASAPPSGQDPTRPAVPPRPLPRPLPGSLTGPTWPRGRRPLGPPGPRSASAPPTGQDLCPPADLPGPLPRPLPGSLPDPTRPRGQQAPGPPGSRSASAPPPGQHPCLPTGQDLLPPALPPGPLPSPLPDALTDPARHRGQHDPVDSRPRDHQGPGLLPLRQLARTSTRRRTSPGLYPGLYRIQHGPVDVGPRDRQDPGLPLPRQLTRTSGRRRTSPDL